MKMETGLFDQEYEMSNTEFTDCIDRNTYVLDKIGYGITIADDLFGNGTKYILVACRIEEYEMSAFCAFCKKFQVENGYVLAVIVRGTNFYEIARALAERGWQKNGNISPKYYSEAICFNCANGEQL